MSKNTIATLLMISLAACGGSSSDPSATAGTAPNTTSPATGTAGATSESSVSYTSTGSTGASSAVVLTGTTTTTTAASPGISTVEFGAGKGIATLPQTRAAGQISIVKIDAGNSPQSLVTIVNLGAGDTVETKTPITDSTWLAAGKSATASFDANEVIVPDLDTASLTDCANYAVRTVAVNSGDAAWFTFNGDTYLVENVFGAEYNFTDGTDVLVKLAGSINLSNAVIVGGAVVLQ